MNGDIIGRIAGLPGLPVPDLKKLWRELYGKEPPPFNKVYFVKRLAYRLQELAYNADSSALNRRLEMHAKQHMDLQGKVIRKAVNADHLAAGTRLMREYQGEEHHVTLIGMSADTIETETEFSSKECRDKFPVAADPDMKVIKAYDAVMISLPGHVGVSDRISYVIAPDGKILYAYAALAPEKHVENTLAVVQQWHDKH